MGRGVPSVNICTALTPTTTLSPFLSTPTCSKASNFAPFPIWSEGGRRARAVTPLQERMGKGDGMGWGGGGDTQISQTQRSALGTKTDFRSHPPHSPRGEVFKSPFSRPLQEKPHHEEESLAAGRIAGGGGEAVPGRGDLDRPGAGGRRPKNRESRLFGQVRNKCTNYR